MIVTVAVMTMIAAAVVASLPLHRQNRTAAAPALHRHHARGEKLVQAQRRPCAGLCCRTGGESAAGRSKPHFAHI